MSTHLTKRDSLIVVAQNCPEFTAAIVDRWQALENQQNQPHLFRNLFSEALMLAAQLQAEKSVMRLKSLLLITMWK